MRPLDPQSRRLIDEVSSGDMPPAELQEQLWQRLVPRMSEALPPTAAAASQALTAKSSLLIGAGTWLKLTVAALLAGAAVTGATHYRSQREHAAAAHEAERKAARDAANREHEPTIRASHSDPRPSSASREHQPSAAQVSRVNDRERLDTAAQRTDAERRERQPSAAQASSASDRERVETAAQRSDAERRARQPSAAQASSASDRERMETAAQRSNAERRTKQRSAAQASSASDRERLDAAAQRSDAERRGHQPSAAQPVSASRSGPQSAAAQPVSAGRSEQQAAAAQSSVRGRDDVQLLAAESSAPGGSALQPTAAARDRGEQASSAQGSTLMAETQLLARAQRALRAGKATAALRLIDEHARSYPRGELAQERAAAEVVALCMLNRWPEARRSQRQFQQTWPGSPMTERVQHACAALNDSGTSPETRSKP